jgi:hypothetical protein
MNNISNMFAGVLVLMVALATEGFCSEPDDEQAIRLIIEDVRQGWLNADGAPFREHFLDFEGARYFEGGGENTGLVDLIEHHVEPEADAFDGFELNFSNIQVHVEGDFAWALVDTEIKATVRESARIIDNRGRATYLFRKVGDSWKVIHTNSASRPVRRQESGH